MICKKRLPFLLLIVGLSGCGSENEDKATNKPAEEKHVPVAKKHKMVVSQEEDDSSEDSKYEEEYGEPHPGNVFPYYNAAKKILKNWNQAISKHKPENLENLYADEVIYYGKKSNKQAIVNQKSDWLKKHTSYKQELGYTDIYYYDNEVYIYKIGPKQFELVAEFTKICIENQKKTEVISYLYFRKFGKEWKIVRETDVITEINLAKKKPVLNLPEGERRYYVGQWSDTRDVPGFAHDQVPYESSLNFTVADNGITGVYHWYSGTARSRTFYLIKSGKIANGILELEVIFSVMDDPAPEDFDEDEPTETWRFKILENNQLFCLSKDSPSYGKTLLLAN